MASALPLSALVELCRSLRHYLGAGLGVTKVFRQQSERGPWAVRGVAGKIAAELEAGHSLTRALKPHKERFPPLFVALVRVGEETGNLPEVFHELERFFDLQLRLRRQFRRQISGPLIRLVLAVLILSGMMLFLGAVNPSFDPLGFGLTGTSGALAFIGFFVGIATLLVGGYYLLRWLMRGRFDAWLLRRPVLGPCLHSLALQRFCLALRLTTETGMSIVQATRLSLRATGNQAFAAGAEGVGETLKGGEELTTALERSGLFPRDFLDVLANAEETGQVAEVMARQAEHYEEESARRLTRLTTVAGYAVWVIVSVLIVFAIFRLYTSYLKTMEGFM